MIEESEFVKKEDMSRLESRPGPSSASPSVRGRRENTVGILRLDIGKPRRSSGSSVEFRTPIQLAAQVYPEPVSPQPSVDRLSVTFAAEEPSVSVASMEKVRFEPDHVPSEAEEEEDYSQSVSAIFQRKASTKRSCKRRRSSSPLYIPGHELEDNVSSLRNRRRSSVFTTSSGDTAISVEEAAQEQILATIKLHKEVLSSVKQQPWNMRRKLRLVRQAQAYIRRHEGALQERLAQSRSTRDILARFNILIVKHWQHTKRELANLMNVLIPWEIRIKEIESHFGSVVASYFTFLRWLFWVNLVTAVVLIVFVAVPEMLMANTKKAGMRKKMLDDEKANATNLFTLWDFDGVLKYSFLFYGYYSHQDPEDKSLAKSIGYKMPLAYFLTELVVYIYSFVAILRRMAENSRQSKLSEKDDECVFTWKLFTGWDYMIGNSETAHNRTASIILGFKEALLEEAEKKRDEGRNWKVTSLRIFAHMNVLWLLGSSVYAVVLVVERSTQPEAEHGWWRKNEITIVVSLITTLFPAFFEGLGIIEQYHPRKKLRMQLARIMALNLLNIYTLIFASFSKINEMSNILQDMRPKNISVSMTQTPSAAFQIGTKVPEPFTVAPSQSWGGNPTMAPEPYMNCFNKTIPCSENHTLGALTMILSVFAANSTTPLIPISSAEDLSSTLGTVLTSYLTTFTNFNDSFLNSSLEALKDFSSLNFSAANESFSTTESFVEYDKEMNSNIDDFYDFIDVNNGLLQDSNTSNFENNTVENTTLDQSDPYASTSKGFEETTFIDVLSTTSNVSSDEELTSTDIFTPSTEHSINNESEQTYFPTESPSPEKICYETVCEPVTKLSNPIIQTSTTGFPMFTTQTTTTTALSEPEVPLYTDLTSYIDTLDQDTCKKLRPLCWETMFGREMVKLTVMDLVMTVLSTLMVDFFRAVFVRYMNNCWCWDLEKKFPQYGDFKIAENILHLVNNQGMVWMGMFFSPGLPLINIIKLAIMMYLRSWAVLTCNVPHEVVFRASRSNNFYLALLLTMLFLCVLPVGYAVVWVVPSWHCGPFSNYHRIYHIFTKSLKKALPYKSIHKAFDYMASPGIVIPLLMLLVLIIYYLISLTSALREANNDLKIQLRRERTEERRKMFQLVDKKRQEAENPVFKWRKAMTTFPQGKLSIADISIDILKAAAPTVNGSAKLDNKHKELIQEFMKKAKRMPSATSEEENGLLDGGDGTDVEQHDSLPYDGSRPPKNSELQIKKEKSTKKVLKEESKTKREGKKKKEKQSESRAREDSVTSGWSDIPEIRIIQTESAEKLDDDNVQTRGKGHSEIDFDEAETSKTASKKSRNKEGHHNTKKKSEVKQKSQKKNEEGMQNDENNSKESSPKKKIKRKTRSSKQTKDEESLVDKHQSEAENENDSDFKLELERTKTEQRKLKSKKLKSENKDSKARDKTEEKRTKTLKQERSSRSKKLDLDKSFSKNTSDDSPSTKKKVVTVSNKKEEDLQLSESEDDKNHETEDEDTYENTDENQSTSDDNDEEDEEESNEASGKSGEEDSYESEEEDSDNVEVEAESGKSAAESKSFDKSKASEKHQQSKKNRRDTESEDSEVSSQNTVRQNVEIQKRKKDKESNVTGSDSSKETVAETPTKKQTKETKGSKKAIARFKIANVLLKEARRRSSAGLEEK